MPIKRRGFVKTMLLAPALSAQQTPSKPQEQPAPQPNTPAVQNSRQPASPVRLKTTDADLAAATRPKYFSASQFATLQKLGDVLMPGIKGNPGALAAQAPEFLDFLISVSPADRQKLYRTGLDALDAHARQKYNKPFAELAKAEWDAILKPLLVVRPWPLDFPNDSLKTFVAQAHDDLRLATMNSREWASVPQTSGRRFRGSRASGLYWKPIDPIDGE